MNIEPAEEAKEIELEAQATSCSNSSSSSSSDELGVSLAKEFRPPGPPPGCKFCAGTKTLHIVDDRCLLNQYFVTPDVLRYDSAVCHVCARHSQRGQLTV